MRQISYINEVTKIRVRVTPNVGATLPYTIFNSDGTVYATKIMNKVLGLDIYETEQVFTVVDEYIGKPDAYDFTATFEVRNTVLMDIKPDLTTVLANQDIINKGVQKSSIAVPHTTNTEN